MFANSGDRPGFAKITKIEADDPSTPHEDQIKASYYTHVMIPAYSLTTQDIVLRNMPATNSTKELHMMVDVEWGGPNPRNGRYEYKEKVQYSLKVILHPSMFNAPINHIILP
jgi:hypothetical protein